MSADLGRLVAPLLDTEITISGVTASPIRQELKRIGVVARVGGGQLKSAAGEFDVTAGWGRVGDGGKAQPGTGKVSERPYTPEERAALLEGAEALGLNEATTLACLGETTCDVFLNQVACWRNVPSRVWGYTLGGYEVLKKWLSYREKVLLGRALTTNEVKEVTNMARRIAALLLLTPALDANYQAVKAAAFAWPPAKGQ